MILKDLRMTAHNYDTEKSDSTIIFKSPFDGNRSSGRKQGRPAHNEVTPGGDLITSRSISRQRDREWGGGERAGLYLQPPSTCQPYIRVARARRDTAAPSEEGWARSLWQCVTLDARASEAIRYERILDALRVFFVLDLGMSWLLDSRSRASDLSIYFGILTRSYMKSKIFDRFWL